MEDLQAEGVNESERVDLISYTANSSELSLTGNQWILDSGTTHHFTPYKGLLSCFSYAPMTVSSTDSSSESIDSGEFDLSLNSTNFALKDVIYVPSIKVNILFTNRLLRDHDISYTNVAEHCLYKQETLLARTDVSNGLPIISTREQL